MSDIKNNLDTDKVGSLLFKLALPAILAQVINVLYNMVDRLYIGHIKETGSQALTGMGVCMPIIMAVSAFAALAAMGGAPRSSIMLGKGKKEEAEKIVGNCFFTLIIMAVVLTVFILVFAEPLLLIFGGSENTIGYAVSYMRIYALGTIFVQTSLGMNAFINAQGFAKTGMFTVLIGAVINIILDPVFIYGFHLGVEGAALATIIAQAVSSIWVIKFLMSDKAVVRIKRKNIKFERAVMFPCLALGLSPFIMQFTEAVISVCFNSSLLKYGGDTAVGAMTILSSIMQFSMLPLQGFTQGSQPIVSFNYGAENIKRVKDTFRILLVSCLTYSFVLWAISEFAPDIFIRIFTGDETLIHFTRHALRIYMASALLFGAQIACQQTFIALGKALTSMFLALLRKVFLLIPLIYILPHFAVNKVDSVFLAEPIADLVAVLTTSTVFFLSFRKLIRNFESDKQVPDNQVIS